MKNLQYHLENNISIVCPSCQVLRQPSRFYKNRNKCKDCLFVQTYAWQDKNKEKVRLSVRKSAKKLYDANPAKNLAAHKKWREDNPELFKKLNNANSKRHYLNNKARYHAKAKRHYEQRKIATPKWVGVDELFLVKEVYRLAKLRTALLGFQWHTDHIIPLRGETVCGLHCIENMRVVPAVLNLKKGNKIC